MDHEEHIYTVYRLMEIHLIAPTTPYSVLLIANVKSIFELPMKFMFDANHD